MRREITAHTHDPIPEARLTEMAACCGVLLHEVKPLELKWGFIPHRIVAHGGLLCDQIAGCKRDVTHYRPVVAVISHRVFH